MDIIKVKNQILRIMFKYISRERSVIFLFGSFAKNKVYPVRDHMATCKEKEVSIGVYPSSDIDIGVISVRPLENSILARIKDELDGVKTLRDIDIVDFSSIQDKDFLKIALQEVKIWHQTKESKVYLNNLKRLMAG